MPSVRASCCPLPLATPSGVCVNHKSSVTLLCLNYKWGLFSMIKQICHASGGNMMECLPSGGWFSLELRPRENHPPSGKHSIMLPPLAWHICIILYFYCCFKGPLYFNGPHVSNDHVITFGGILKPGWQFGKVRIDYYPKEAR